MDLGLQDKVALVTGGSKGIGLGIVRSLITEGARVANVNRSEAEGRALEAEYAQLHIRLPERRGTDSAAIWQDRCCGQQCGRQRRCRSGRRSRGVSGITAAKPDSLLRDGSFFAGCIEGVPRLHHQYRIEGLRNGAGRYIRLRRVQRRHQRPDARMGG